MKRQTIHTGFAAITIGLAVFTTVQWLAVGEGESMTQAVAQIPASMTSDDESARSIQQFRYPETLLARANALSEGGSFEQAESAFNDLIRQHKFDAIGQAAQFNLANAYLRQGMRSDVAPSRSAPMLELAKQRYRDLLRAIPNDWDSRYNLERALRLAPENAETLADGKVDPVKSVRVIVPDFKAIDLP